MMSNIIDFPIKDIEYITNKHDEIVGVRAPIGFELIEFYQWGEDKDIITQLCIAWLCLEKPSVIKFDEDNQE